MIFVVVRPKSLLSRHFLIGGLINELLGFVSFNKKQRNGMNNNKKKQKNKKRVDTFKLTIGLMSTKFGTSSKITKETRVLLFCFLFWYDATGALGSRKRLRASSWPTEFNSLIWRDTNKKVYKCFCYDRLWMKENKLRKKEVYYQELFVESFKLLLFSLILCVGMGQLTARATPGNPLVLNIKSPLHTRQLTGDWVSRPLPSNS